MITIETIVVGILITLFLFLMTTLLTLQDRRDGDEINYPP